jgi:hypothetical protein
MNDSVNINNYNPNPNVEVDADKDTQGNIVTQCANCGMPREEWRGNAGQGFQMGDNIYCCQGCATGTGCTCS